jgi:hypothetical protein
MHCGAEVTESSTNKQHHLSVTPRKWPVAMHSARESTPPHPIDEFCSLRCAVDGSHKQCTVAPESTTRKFSGAH